MEKVRSPLTGSENVVLEKEIDTHQLIKQYKTYYNINIDRFFVDVPSIYIYKCLDTGYRFYYPYTIGGDGEFYEQLQKLDWYYMDWKWEYEKVKQLISNGSKILEIGCGKGAFLQILNKTYSNIQCIGLELNQQAVESGIKQGLTIFDESIQEHSKQNPYTYDIVCSFQVMEHVAQIKEIIASSLYTLKQGGRLIISVPNNDSFLGYDENYLNMPPHHMGLWNAESLNNLTKIFPIEVQSIFFEPLQDYHTSYCNQVVKNMKEAKRMKRIQKYRLVGRVMNKLLAPIENTVDSKLLPTFYNFTVIAVYQKI